MITLVDVSQTQTAMLEISATQTQMPVNLFPMSAKLTPTVTKDLLVSVLLMMMVNLLNVNIVSPTVSTMSVNQDASMTLGPTKSPDVPWVSMFVTLTPTTAKLALGLDCLKRLSSPPRDAMDAPMRGST